MRTSQGITKQTERNEDVLIPFRTRIPGHEVFALRSANLSEDSRRTIVLVHGAIASRRYMIPTARLLAKNFRVLLPDLPGHGDSSKPAHALSPAALADALHSWLETLAVKKADFVANSYGCQIMARYAVKYPQSVDHLLLTDPTGDPSADTLWQRFGRLFLDGFVEPPLAPLMMWRDIFDMGIRRTFETANRMREDNIRESLPLITTKTLIVRGEKDAIAPQKWCEQVASIVPGSRLVVIPGAPHSVNSAAAPQLTEIINDFVLNKV